MVLLYDTHQTTAIFCNEFEKTMYGWKRFDLDFSEMSIVFMNL